MAQLSKARLTTKNKFVFKDPFFYFIYVSVSSTYVCIGCAWYPWRQEEGTESPESVVKDVSCHVGNGN